MFSQISIWAKGIIIVTLVGTILQMVLPDCNNKKYIKIIIGVFILITIIKPVIGKSINLNSINFEDYTNYNNTSVKDTSEENVMEIFRKKVITTIGEKINNMRL